REYVASPHSRHLSRAGETLQRGLRQTQDSLAGCHSGSPPAAANQRPCFGAATNPFSCAGSSPLSIFPLTRAVSVSGSPVTEEGETDKTSSASAWLFSLWLRTIGRHALVVCVLSLLP